MKKDILIPAALNGTPGVYRENISDPGFSIVSTTAGFQVVVGSQPAQSLASGMAVGAANGPALGLVTFQNTTTSDIHVSIGDFALARPTIIQATAGTFIGANSLLYNFNTTTKPSQVFPGTDSNGFQRKSITVTNTGRASVGGAAVNDIAWIALPGQDLFVIIFPGAPPFTLESSADLRVGSGAANLSSGADLAVAIMEIFYSKPLQTDQ